MDFHSQWKNPMKIPRSAMALCQGRLQRSRFDGISQGGPGAVALHQAQLWTSELSQGKGLGHSSFSWAIYRILLGI